MPLAEVAEQSATGRIAEIYDDIRRVLGLPMVNLVYRHLATGPDVLEETWAALRPNLGSAAASAVAAELGGAARAGDTLAGATLDAYARANSLNVLGMWALVDGCPGTGVGGDPVEPPPVAKILPMADLESLPPRVYELSAALIGEEEPRIVPSLLRHFAGRDDLLDRIDPAAVSVRGAATAERARELAAALPYPVAQSDDGAVREIAVRFARAQSRMLAVGEALREAL